LPKKKTTIQFEEAIETLETIVGQMEDGKIGLDDSLNKYEEAMKLIQVCQDKLSQAEKKIEIIKKNNTGTDQSEEIDMIDERLF